MVTISPEPTDCQPDPAPKLDIDHLRAWLDTSEKYGRETVTLPVEQVRSLLDEVDLARLLDNPEGIA